MSKQEEIEIDYDDVEDPNYQIKLINSVKELIMHKFKKAGYSGNFWQNGENIKASCSVRKGNRGKRLFIEFNHDMISVEILSGYMDERKVKIKHKHLIRPESNNKDIEKLVGNRIDEIIEVLVVEIPEIFLQ